jgi:hypothetical protein
MEFIPTAHTKLHLILLNRRQLLLEHVPVESIHRSDSASLGNSAKTNVMTGLAEQL